ncbi:MAG TPA: DUF4390 domain-containing protein [Gemmatimonadales bacterium]|jgi:hypothetical protein|nr:DUF4390 domain-containing protein [Gemmatimonadales bacterium]
MRVTDLRRILALGVGLALGIAGPLASQDGVVRVSVALTPDTAQSGQRNPEVRTSAGLLEEDRWVSMLRSGFPLRMHYRVEIWRSRSAWFDDLVRQVEWDVVVRHEPLLDQYAVNTIMPGRARENRYTGIDPLARALEAVVYRIAFRPPPPGEYYYVASLQVSTLSDSDLDELERFLRGDLGPAASEGRDLGDALGRGATRVLLKLAGVPSLRIEGRSERFRVK